jgi:predicted dehydrogenase
MRRLRAAVIGVGYLGRYHALKYQALPQVDLVGVVDIQAERARKVAEQLRTRAFTDYRDLIGRIEAATVAVPTTEHHPIARELLEHGIHVLVEKPIAATIEQAEDLVDVAGRQGAILQVGHLERFNPAVQALAGRVTNPLFVESHRISPFAGRGLDVDVVLDLMIHDIDILLSTIRTDIVQLDAVGVPVLTPRYDIVNARFRFGSGCVANVTASRVSAKSMRKIRVFQHDAYLSADCTGGEVQVFRRIPAAGSSGLPQIVAEKVVVEASDPLLEEVRSFVEAVGNRKPPLVDGMQGLRCLEVAHRIIRQIEESVPERLRETLAESDNRV